VTVRPSASAIRSAPPPLTRTARLVEIASIVWLACTTRADVAWGAHLPLELLYAPGFAVLAWHGRALLAGGAALVCAVLPLALQFTGLEEARTVTAEAAALRTVAFLGVVVVVLAARARWSALLELSHEDPLTGLVHQGAFVDAVGHELARQRRVGGFATVLSLDLDGFKQLNDTRGHAFGNRALVGVAHELSRCLRGGDVVARTGGDEFAVLLTGTDAAAGAVVCQHLRAALTAWASAESVPIGFSFGSATSDPRRDVNVAELLDRADREMYREKERHHAETGTYSRRDWPSPA
jgi:diguanylate cyclase (GGDEF)-like protein